MVAVWRMKKGGGIREKASTSSMETWNMYGNRWIALHEGDIKAPLEQLRPAAREGAIFKPRKADGRIASARWTNSVNQ